MISRLITPPTELPVSVSEVKAAGRIQIVTEDGLIERWIRMATELGQAKTRRQFITATWRTWQERFPCYGSRLMLDWGPLIAVTSVEYIDSAGATQTLDPSYYTVDSVSLVPAIDLAVSFSWPTTYEIKHPVWVTYTAGFGSTASAVPQPIRDWIISRTLAHYEHREQLADRAPEEMPYAFSDGLLDPYTVQTI